MAGRRDGRLSNENHPGRRAIRGFACRDGRDPEHKTRTIIVSVPVDFQTDPSQYQHWKLTFNAAVAQLAMDTKEDGGIQPGYKLKLNSYDLGVDIELHAPIQRIPFDHPYVRLVVIT